MLGPVTEHDVGDTLSRRLRLQVGAGRGIAEQVDVIGVDRERHTDKHIGDHVAAVLDLLDGGALRRRQVDQDLLGDELRARQHAALGVDGVGRAVGTDGGDVDATGRERHADRQRVRAQVGRRHRGRRLLEQALGGEGVAAGQHHDAVELGDERAQERRCRDLLPAAQEG